VHGDPVYQAPVQVRALDQYRAHSEKFREELNGHFGGAMVTFLEEFSAVDSAHLFLPIR
jgi:hypothetical protein